jgi:hypothetical protein
MIRELQCHPGTPSAAIDQILLVITRPAAAVLALDLVLRGAVQDLRLPPHADPVRTDGLWKHSCFETFIQLPDGSGYLEFNFSPSRQWAAYRFDAYRTGMRPLEVGAPAIEDRMADDYRFGATLALDGVTALPAQGVWRLGVSAVIEDAAGLSYWALAHPPQKPDFHHRDCFVLELAPA